MAQGPVTANLGPGLVHGGYGSLHLDDGPGLHGVAQHRPRVPAVRPPEPSGLSMVKRDPSWVIWSMHPMGFT